MATVRKALVTGASRGIGRALAVELAANGIGVVGTGRDERALDETRALSAPQLFTAALLDVTDSGAVGRLINAHSDLDFCFVNAGIATQTPFHLLGVAELRSLFEVNVVGAFVTMQAAASAMTARGKGRIIVIASDGAYRGIAGMASYVASKHALLGLARSLALELDGSGVNLTIVYPGPVRTEILGELSANGNGMDSADVARLIVTSVLLPSLRSVELRLHPGATT